MTKVGDLRVWWIPQLGCGAEFIVPVASVTEGAKIIETLAQYDLFQLENRIKPNYANAGGLQRYEADAGEEAPGWCDWYDVETGDDDVSLWLAKQPSAALQTLTDIDQERAKGNADDPPYSALLR